MYFLNQNKKLVFRIAAVVMMISLLMCTFTGCLEESEEPESSKQSVSQKESEKTQQESNDSIVLSFYSELQDNEAYPYTLTDKATVMLAQNENLFLDNNIDGCEENADYTLEYKSLDKNIDKYGDKLLYLPEVMVLQIEETDVDEETTVTEMLVCDADENCYQILSLCGYDNIYKEDIISVYGLPIAKSGFENVSGGTTLVIIVAASHIEKTTE